MPRDCLGASAAEAERLRGRAAGLATVMRREALQRGGRSTCSGQAEPDCSAETWEKQSTRPEKPSRSGPALTNSERDETQQLFMFLIPAVMGKASDPFPISQLLLFLIPAVMRKASDPLTLYGDSARVFA